jgi:hypothetical protein
VRLAPALPLDARIREVTLDGAAREHKTVPRGDGQRAETEVELPAGATRRVVVAFDEGSEVYARQELPDPGGRSEGLRILRSRAENGALRLTLEGRGGHSYTLGVRTAKQVGTVDGVTVGARGGRPAITVAFAGSADAYVRREIVLPLR